MSEGQFLTLTKESVDRAILSLRDKPQPTHIIIPATNHVMLKAFVEFAGRDRRRVKREVHKAYRKQRKKDIAEGHGRPARSGGFDFWRPTPSEPPQSPT